MIDLHEGVLGEFAERAEGLPRPRHTTTDLESYEHVGKTIIETSVVPCAVCGCPGCRRRKTRKQAELRSEKYLTTGDLVRYCGVTEKTIQSWAAAGKLPHFQTPSGRLRFRPKEVLSFLERYGFTAPSDLR